MREDRTSEQLRLRGLRLEWATNGWNAMEVVVTISLGWQARSLALIAFGLDSLVEIFASTVVIWNLRDDRHDPGDRRIHRALRLIAVAFGTLAAFLTVMSVRSLALGERPDESPLGIAYLAITAVAMFGLSRLKRTTADELDSETLDAEAAMTFLDGCLSTGILTALVLNASFGWWWTDATAALVVAGFAINEGVEHWRVTPPRRAERHPRARIGRRCDRGAALGAGPASALAGGSGAQESLGAPAQRVWRSSTGPKMTLRTSAMVSSSSSTTARSRSAASGSRASPPRSGVSALLRRLAG